MTSDYMAQEGSEGPGREPSLRPAGSFLSGDKGLVVQRPGGQGQGQWEGGSGGAAVGDKPGRDFGRREDGRGYWKGRGGWPG